jgi:hypothetical protein
MPLTVVGFISTTYPVVSATAERIDMKRAAIK